LKALILNGSRKGDSALDSISEIVADELSGISYGAETLLLHDSKIASCLGCFDCWVKTPGICIINDAGRDVAMKMVQSDLIVLLTPVTFGGYSSELKKAIDRQIPNVLPFFTKIDGEVHHKPRYERYTRLVGIGVLPSPDEESERLFEKLVGRNAINMHSPAHSAGVIYTSQNPEEVHERVRTLLVKAGVRG